MSDTIADSLERDAVDGVQHVSVDGQSVTAMSVSDRIKAANYLAGQNATARNHLGLRIVKLVPPGGG
jgi:hypothetical protein